VYDKEPDQSEYDYEANDMNHLREMLGNNIIPVNSTVLVNKNPDTGNFWSLWKVISNNEVKLIRAQLYDTSDFMKYSDYYSSLVDPKLTPTKIFKNINERNDSLDIINEDEIILVKDVGGFWEWQLYKNNIFTTVAKQNATISFSDKFFLNKVVYGINEKWGDLDEKELLYRIKNRDGSLELRILLEIFRNGYMDNLLLNEMFFSCVRFALSENKPVDWVMKSSYVLFGGFYESLSQSSIFKPSLFESILEYIEEIKPYHVKFRDFYRRLKTEDTYKFDANDFDFPDENMRKIKIKQKFDRVTCDSSDEDPVSIIIRSNGYTNKYDLIVDDNNVYTIPKITDYQVYKTNVMVQPWDKNNIDFVALKDLSNNTYTELSEKDWEINEIVYLDPNTTTYKKKLVIVFNFIPKENILIEIKRRLYASDRINYYYTVIDKLVNNKEVKHKIPEKNIKELISYCKFRGTTVEGGSLVYSRKDFQITLNNANLYSNWDIEPDKEFIKNNLISEILPDGNSFTSFVSAYGDLWLEKYYEIYSVYTNDNVIKYLNSFYENYSWDINPWDGVTGISSSEDSEEIEGIISAKNNLYDIIYESGTQLSGYPDFTEYSSALSNWPDIDNVSTSAINVIVEGNKFVQPYMGPRHPEELTLLKNKDLLIFDNHLIDLPGGVKSFLITKKGTLEYGDEFLLEEFPQSKESIMFFVNGILLDFGTDYDIDWEYQKVIYKGTSLTSNDNQICIRYYTYGGNRLRHRCYYRAKNANSGFYGYIVQKDFDLINVLSAQNIFATIDGIIVSAIDVVNNEVFLDLSGVTVTANSLVILNIYDSPSIVKVRTKDYILMSGQTSLDIGYISNQLLPIEQNVLVFSSGKRLLGPNHRYFFYEDDGIYDVGIDLSGVSFNVYINEELTSDYTLVSGNASLIEITSSFAANSLITVQIYDNPTEYTIITSGNSTSVVFASSKSFDSSLKIITFENNHIQDIKTEKFEGNAEGKYRLSLSPYSINSLIVHVDGISKIYSIDYNISIATKGYDEETYGGNTPYGLGDDYIVIDFNQNQTGQKIYVTYSVGEEMSEELSYRSFKPYISEGEDIRISNKDLFVLDSVVSVNSNVITLRENENYPKGLLHIAPLITPDPAHNVPGVIWIDGERIEYFRIDSDIDTKGKYWQISTLNRASRETSRGVKLKKESRYFSTLSSKTKFVVSGYNNLNINNIVVNILNFAEVEDKWDYGEDLWDYDDLYDFAYDVSKDTQLPLYVSGQMVILSSVTYAYVSGNTITLSNTIDINDNVLNIVDLSSIHYPLNNLRIDIFLEDWTTTNVEHDTGEKVLNGNSFLKIPGGFNPYYNRDWKILHGLQRVNDIQSEFLKR
jgi:hypothetical protein